MGVTSQRSRGRSFSEDAAGGQPQVLLIGTSYKSAKIGFREALAKAVEDGRLLDSLGSPRETAVLSTCNRLEVYLASARPDAAADSFFRQAQEIQGSRRARDGFFVAKGGEAVRHLFRVAAGLDSVVVGEAQILSQVRSAGIGSRKRGTAGAVLGPLFDRAYRVGSRVRAAYSFESEDASLSDLAVDAVQRLSPGRHDVMLIGTGKMVRLAARRLQGSSKRIVVVTRRRTPPKGLEGAKLVGHSQIRETARECDVIVSATSSVRPLLAKRDLAGRKKRVVVDLGMPRNVSPEVRELPNVKLLDLDDLAKLTRRRRRRASARAAELATAREADAFYDWLVQTRLTSTLGEMYSWADGVREDELRRAAGKLNLSSEKDRWVLDAMGRRIVSKLLSKPTEFARRKHATLSEEEKLELLRSVFGVDGRDGR